MALLRRCMCYITGCFLAAQNKFSITRHPLRLVAAHVSDVGDLDSPGDCNLTWLRRRSAGWIYGLFFLGAILLFRWCHGDVNLLAGQLCLER